MEIIIRSKRILICMAILTERIDDMVKIYIF